MSDSGSRSFAQTFVRLSGVFIVLVALGFVGTRISDNLGYLSEFNVDTSLFLSVVVWSVFYALVSLALSFAWFALLNSLGGPSLNFWNCHRIYARSQIAKYIPGNIFHLGGRHALGAQKGLDHSALFAAAILEAGGVVLSASIITLAALSLGPENLWGYSSDYYLCGLLLALIAPIVLVCIAPRLKLLRKIRLFDAKPALVMRQLFTVLVLYILFFVLSGSIIIGIDCYIRGVDGMQDWAVVVVVYAISWVAGFVTPGASAGIGVREAVIVAWLGGVVGEGHGLFIALIFRIVTVLGDVFLFASSFIVGKRESVI